MVRRISLAFTTLVLLATASHATSLEARIGYLRVPVSKPVISPLDQRADNDGVAGARLAIEDGGVLADRSSRSFFVCAQRRGGRVRS
jgi:hypothetical protein